MSAAELLLKAGVETQKIERGALGMGDITEQDVLTALGMIKHSHASLLLRVKYLEQHAFAWKLFYAFFMHVHCKMSVPGKWSDEPHYRHHLVWDMCKIALDDYCTPPLCPTCNGIKSKAIGALVVDCPDCGASGLRSRQDQAWRLHLTERAWETWGERYKSMLIVLDRWESIGLGAISQRLDKNA